MGAGSGPATRWHTGSYALIAYGFGCGRDCDPGTVRMHSGWPNIAGRDGARVGVARAGDGRILGRVRWRA